MDFAVETPYLEKLSVFFSAVSFLMQTMISSAVKLCKLKEAGANLRPCLFLLLSCHLCCPGIIHEVIKGYPIILI